MTCLLAVDVGNTNTVLGVFRGSDLVNHFRIETNAGRTSDELAVLVRSLLELQGFAWGSLDAGIVSSVVPPAVFPIQRFFKQYLGAPALVVGPGIKTGMPILYENPREVGADRIVNAVAAFEAYHCGCIIVDFGTATTWDVVTPRGEYLGGAIAPGIQISAEALYSHAAKLPRVEIHRPGKVIGRNTVSSMQSGLLYGYAGMVDALVTRIRAEVDFPAKCLATGGLARLLASESSTIETTDELLTLKGLKILYDRNVGGGHAS
ncbi:MAG: type III pantothenate kinase [Myxococcales bacterium]|jgi:type III pantothenate kinase|nr:type III pantothenate kinase [Myxococcales bacterium]MBK7195938.1 type III pantothenate kinase [Myxococcales bacterium]MBP6843176.1 type III pantothenate kinase [Kofleriaceae bacterium]